MGVGEEKAVGGEAGVAEAAGEGVGEGGFGTGNDGNARPVGEGCGVAAEGGVFVGDEKVSDVAATVAADAFGEDGVIVRKGKKTFHKFTK